MMEQLRRLLERYPITPPMAVQTDLSAARAPSYAVTQRGRKRVSMDIAGGACWVESFAFTMRQVAVTEPDRQRAYQFLYDLGEWMEKTELPQPLTGIEAEPPNLQEAYDDGTAVWSMVLHLTWEQKDSNERKGLQL